MKSIYVEILNQIIANNSKLTNLKIRSDLSVNRIPDAILAPKNLEIILENIQAIIDRDELIISNGQSFEKDKSALYIPSTNQFSVFT